jgi:hypothetical protein
MARDDNKSAQEDQAWLAALCGKTETGPAARLGRMLREVELADAAQEDTTHDWQRLQFAIRREQAKPRTSYKYYAIAASVLVMVGSVALLMKPGDVGQPTPMEAATMMRGAAEQVLLSAAPARDAQQLEKELMMLGVKVVKTVSADKTELHIALAYPVNSGVRAVLESRVIPVPEQGDLTVVFVQTNPAK